MRILINKGGLLIVEVDGIKWLVAGYLRIHIPWILRNYPDLIKVFPPVK